MKPTTVDEYVASLPAEHAAIVSELRNIVKKAAPKATEAYKWAQPVYETNGPMIWIRAYKSYVNIGFWRGTEMIDKHELLEGDGERMRHVKLNTIKDIKKGALTDYIKQAVKLNLAKGNPTLRMTHKKA
jgi:hypothetical protein